ncbi:MAG: ATP-binding cassette domain-containing protein [Acholeplasmataceae bacterium]
MIRLDHVKKIYPMHQYDINALDGVSFSLDQKGFISLVGPSGCGKTTLLNILGGLDHPTEGTVYFNDISTDDFDETQWNSYRNQNVGFVFQSFYLIPHLSILDNVMLPLKLAGIPLEEQKERATLMLAKVGLKDFISHRPNQLSGGQQQRVAIARALITEPKIILADEPTGSLDHQSSIEVMDILKSISKDRLVLMVTHNETLSKRYSDRIITMDSGLVVNDEWIKQSSASTSGGKLLIDQTSKMSIVTSFKLSFHNLMKRFYRTLLMVLAASIGVMGITLVLAVASGFDQYLELRKTETLNAFPIRIERISVVIPFFDEKYKPNLPEYSDIEVAYPRNIQYEFQTINTLTPDYYNHVQGLDETLYTNLHYNYGTFHQFAIINSDTVFNPEKSIRVLDVDETYLGENFDLLSGRLPEDASNEAVIVLDRYNRLSKDVAQYLGFAGDLPITFDMLMSLEMKWIPNNVLYTLNGTQYDKASLSSVYQHDDVGDVPIVGIIRIKEKFHLDYLRTGLYFNEHLYQTMREDATQSDIVISQLQSQESLLDGSPLTSSQKESLLRDLGYASYPIGYTIYSSNFESKDQIMRYLRSYNDQVSINDAIEPLDIAGIGLSTMRVAIDSTTVILLVFSGISLLISNLMIGIMTYTSVIERTKEIGILRAIGARRKDVGNIFYAETLMIGCLAGLFGVVISYLLIPLFNLFLYHITTINHLARLHPLIALGLVMMSMILTSISGILPARIASKKDPILCLRNE